MSVKPMMYQMKYECNGYEGSAGVIAATLEEALEKFAEERELWGADPVTPWITGVWALSN